MDLFRLARFLSEFDHKWARGISKTIHDCELFSNKNEVDDKSDVYVDVVFKWAPFYRIINYR